MQNRFPIFDLALMLLQYTGVHKALNAPDLTSLIGFSLSSASVVFPVSFCDIWGVRFFYNSVAGINTNRLMVVRDTVSLLDVLETLLLEVSSRIRGDGSANVFPPVCLSVLRHVNSRKCQSLGLVSTKMRMKMKSYMNVFFPGCQL